MTEENTHSLIGIFGWIGFGFFASLLQTPVTHDGSSVETFRLSSETRHFGVRMSAGIVRVGSLILQFVFAIAFGARC